MTFKDEIIHKSDSQASIGPQTIFGKGSTISPQVARSSVATHIEIHDKTVGSEKIFQDTSVRHLNASTKSEGHSFNLREGKVK